MPSETLAAIPGSGSQSAKNAYAITSTNPTTSRTLTDALRQMGPPVAARSAWLEGQPGHRAPASRGAGVHQQLQRLRHHHRNWSVRPKWRLSRNQLNKLWRYTFVSALPAGRQ